VAILAALRFYILLCSNAIHAASIAAATPPATDGNNLPYCSHKLTPTPQQRHRPVLSPPVRHNGGCSRVCRRFLWRKLHTTVALPVLAAVHFGDNLANFANH
jgi:hypothetical protein